MDHQREHLIYLYFHLGLNNKEILACLAHGHGIIISVRTLKRITSRLQLYRRKNQSDILEVAQFILEQCEGQGQLYGYRWLHAKCTEHGLIVSQDTVRYLQSFIDPEGVSFRKKKRLRRRKYINYGPNAVWHIDGNDKLKPYGICIHGCIDGFSRNIIWIHAYKTNNNPQVVAGYFIEEVKNRKGCPERVRGDEGTENRHIEQIQLFLRSNHDDQYAGQKSFLYGSSTNNQRIEWWWGLLRRQGLQYWINLFQQLKYDGYFSGNFLDKSLIQFCFTSMIQAAIEDIAYQWNCHCIRHSKNSNAPDGRPMIMYSMPYLYGVTDHICHVENDQIQICEAETMQKSIIPCDETVFELCTIILDEMQWEMPSTASDMCDMYIALRAEIYNNL